MEKWKLCWCIARFLSCSCPNVDADELYVSLHAWEAMLRSELFSTKLSNFSPRARTLLMVLCCAGKIRKQKRSAEQSNSVLDIPGQNTLFPLNAICKPAKKVLISSETCIQMQNSLPVELPSIVHFWKLIQKEANI